MTKNNFLLMGAGNSFKGLASHPRLTIEQILNAESSRATPNKAYKKLDAYHRCVEFVGGSVSSMPWAIEKIDGGEDDGPVWTNGDMVPDELSFLGDPELHIWLCATSDALKGAAYLFKDRKYKRAPVQSLRWLAPDTIEPVISRSAGITGFLRDTGDGTPRQTFPLEDIMYMFSPDPNTEVGPSDATDAESARVSADVLLNMGTFMTKYFDQGMIKATLLRVNERASIAEVSRVQKWWTKFMEGIDNAFRSKIIQSGGIDPITIGEGLKDIADQDISEKMVRRICYAFGVPITVLDGGRDNSSDILAYLESVAIPRSRRIAHMFNKQLLEERGYRLKAHPQKLEHFQQRELEKANQIMRLVGRPIMTVNEGRSLMELKGIDGGEQLQDFQLFTNPMGTDVPKDPNPARGPEVTEKEDEAAKWYRKVKKSGIDTPFKCYHLDQSEQNEIVARMKSGMDLRRCFDPPWSGF